MNETQKKAWVVSMMMGLGHMRAAYPLRELGGNTIDIDGSREFCTPEEFEVWERVRYAYYFMSRTEDIPFIGKKLFAFMRVLQQIPPYYPRRDLSAATGGAKYLSYLIKKHGLCASLVQKIKTDTLPIVNTFYASGIAIDMLAGKKRDNYLLICDSDFNRVWVPEHPEQSTLKYLAPCTRVKRRLLSYGVPEERICLTGFPLPKENIGTAQGLEILKEDLFNRLVRLDPSGHFAAIHGKTVEYYLGRDLSTAKRDDAFELTFAVGGAGAQSDMAIKILRGLKKKIMEGKLRLNLVAGIRKDVYRRFKENIETLGLTPYLGEHIRIIYDENIYRYFDRFNAVLRTTDVLWTKPSELSFYCALGLPILMATAVGTHEELNRKWLQDTHTGVKPDGPEEYAGEWLFDLRDGGVLAEAAWDGFLKGRKLGTYRIEELVTTGAFASGNSPLER
jgi:hypothetical protein